MKRTVTLLAVVLVAACATLRGPDAASLHYEAGLQAVARHDFAAAIDHLEDAAQSSDPNIAERALLLRVAVELDPRNPAPDYEAAARRAALIRDAAPPGSWERLSADGMAQAAAAALRARQEMETLTIQRDAALATAAALRIEVDSLRSERDAARRKVQQLELASAEMEKELQKKTAELERIRRVIR